MNTRESHGKARTARAAAAALLVQVLMDKRTLDEAVAAQPLAGSDEDQRFTMALVLTVLQHLGQLDAVIVNYLEKPLPAKRMAVMNALRLGAAQLLVMDTPAHAAVSESVELVKRGKDAALAGLVNAVLKKIAAQKPALPSPLANLPAWLRGRWEKAYGADVVVAITQVASAKPPLDVFYAEGHQRLAPGHPPVESLPGYDSGAFFVQDMAASYPVRFLGEVRGQTVLDLCAAPGGKTMQLIRAGAKVTALDRSETRMKRVRENLTRLNMQAELITADMLEWQPAQQYDAILLDAPCTATGTWRRHPEVVQLVTEADIAEMAVLQRQLLALAWAWLKPGGRLVYCVCSLEPEEGEAQASWFTAQQRDAHAMAIAENSEIPPAAIAGNYLRTHPALMQESGGMDGFFAACFVKNQ